MNYVKTVQSNLVYPLDEYEMRYEECDLHWMADFNIHNLVFCVNDLKLKDNKTIAKVVNALFDQVKLFISNKD
jgi:hypothetical protein